MKTSMILKTLLTLTAAAAFTLGPIGCDGNDGPAETAGEKIDRGIDKVEEGVEDAADDVKDATN